MRIGQVEGSMKEPLQPMAHYSLWPAQCSPLASRPRWWEHTPAAVLPGGALLVSTSSTQSRCSILFQIMIARLHGTDNPDSFFSGVIYTQRCMVNGWTNTEKVLQSCVTVTGEVWFLQNRASAFSTRMCSGYDSSPSSGALGRSCKWKTA